MIKVNWKKLFSLSVSDAEYFGDSQDKIEVSGCKKDQLVCMNYLPEINRLLKESDVFFRERDYNRSLEALEQAYQVTHELRQSDCLKCADIFRATIVESLEEISAELEGMTKGFFRTQRYLPCRNKAEQLLNRYKNIGDSKSKSFHRSEKRVYLPAV